MSCLGTTPTRAEKENPRVQTEIVENEAIAAKRRMNPPEVWTSHVSIAREDEGSGGASDGR
jgi:hypothetical protein